MAPHPALISYALFAVPTLPSQLEELGYVPGAQGYGQLRDAHGLGTLSPTVRTVQKMLHQGDLVKYTVADGIVQLLNNARAAQNLELLDRSLIEGHVYYLDGFQGALERLRHKGVSRGEALRALSEHAGCMKELVSVMTRCTNRVPRKPCEAVRDAFRELYGVELTLSDRPTVVAAKAKRKPVVGRKAKTIKAAPASLLLFSQTDDSGR